MRRLLLGPALVVAYVLLVPGAQGFWGLGGTCWRQAGNEGHHCYAEERWKMSGYPTEYVDGAVLDMDTLSSEVPGFASGDFVSDELWLSFDEHNYIETGQITGWSSSLGCCSLHRFWSYTLNGVQGGHTVIDSQTIAPGGTYNSYEIYDPCHCGSWGIWWNGANPAYQGTQVAELGTPGAPIYPTWANELQNGMEAAANTQPYNWARSEVAAVVPPNDVWTEWKSGYGVHSEPLHSPHQCVSRNPESGHWGNVSVSTCVIEQ